MAGRAYLHLTYEEYKALEKACREFNETSHTSERGFYHKAICLPFGEQLVEFIGPNVPAGYQLVEADEKGDCDDAQRNR